MKKAGLYLQEKDPILRTLIERYGFYRPSPPTSDGWSSLCRTIMFQQLAGSAASAIQKRWLASYKRTLESGFPSPRQVLNTRSDVFKAAGVSQQKASYLQSLAEHVESGDLDFDELTSLNDQDVITRITQVHGLGVWSAHMFLMSQLRRPNILPVGDLGVRNGMKIAYQVEGVVTPKVASEIGQRWEPYCSAGSWYMWKVADGDQDFFNDPVN